MIGPSRTRDVLLMARLGAAVVFSWLLVIAPAVRAEPERIVLRGGQVVIGEVLSEKSQVVYLDLGYDLLKIPRDEILSRGPAESVEGDAGPSGSGDQRLGLTGFFTTLAQAPRIRPVTELVEDMGSAVISIETPTGSGSGFFINDEGYAITNYHVIEGETRIAAIIYQRQSNGWSRRRVDGVEIVALNSFVDLALVRVRVPAQDELKLRSVPLGNQREVNVGDSVFAIGNPLGLERSVSQGIISTRNRNFEGLVYLQTDAAINPGNSGGPLLNLRGEVIGVTNMKATQGDNVGFAIPITYVKEFLDNREAFAYDNDNPNTGYRYLDPPRRTRGAAVSAQEKHASKDTQDAQDK